MYDVTPDKHSDRTWHRASTQEMLALLAASELYGLPTHGNKVFHLNITEEKYMWGSMGSGPHLRSDLGHWLILLQWPGISSYTSSIQTFTFAVSSAWDFLPPDIFMTSPSLFWCLLEVHLFIGERICSSNYLQWHSYPPVSILLPCVICLLTTTCMLYIYIFFACYILT